MKNPFSHRLSILFILVVLFAAPGCIAFLLFSHPQWLSNKTTNKGRFVPASIPLMAENSNKKWQLVFWSKTTCDAACIQQLEKLQRIRIALGRRLYEVDEVLILGRDSEMPSQKLLKILKEQNIRFDNLENELAEKILSKEGPVFIVNPNHYPVLAYFPTANPNDIYQDLKHLLNSSETKEGSSHVS